MTPEIEVGELDRLFKTSEPLVIDVREADEVATASIGRTRHIPMNEIPQHVAEFGNDEPIYVMCHHGGRSERVVQWLHAAGKTNAVNVRGGIDAWSREVDPAVPRY